MGLERFVSDRRIRVHGVGLRKITTYLHDGRATTLEQAILAHDGQGRNARDRFAALGSGGEQLMYAFLNSL
jgi:CxxC motif-containing protein (DUF1111 family)